MIGEDPQDGGYYGGGETFEQSQARNSSAPAAERPGAGFLESIGLGFRRAAAQEDWGYNQVRWRGRATAEIDAALQDRGYPVDRWNREAQWGHPFGSAEPNPWYQGPRSNPNAYWDAVASERRRDANFLSRYRDVHDLSSLEQWVLQARNEEIERIDARNPGIVGSFIGQIARLDDPINLLPLGWAGKGTTVARQLISSFWRGGAVAMGLTAAVEPMVREDAAALGRPRTAGDFVRDFAVSGAAGGSINLGMHAAPHIARPIANAFTPVDRRIASALSGAEINPGAHADIEAARAFTESIGADKMSPEQRAAAHVVTRDARVRMGSPFLPSPGGDDANVRWLDAAMAGISGSEEAARGGAPRPVSRADVRGGTADMSRVRSPAREQVKARIWRVEGDGRNAASGADGHGQFLESTWLPMYRRRYPRDRRSDAQVLALRRDSHIANVIMDDALAGYGAALRQAGAPESAGNLYLSHAVGPDTAVAFLREPGRPAADIVRELNTRRLGAEGAARFARTALRNNPWLRGSAGEAIAWTRRQMGEAGASAGSGRRVAFVDSFSRYGGSSPGQAPGAPRPHRGGTHASNARDYGMPENTPLIAELDWELVASPRSRDGGRSTNTDGDGKWFAVRYSDGSVHIFRHVNEVPTRQSGRAGEAMGRSGRTGVRSSGPHTHRESWVRRDGRLVGIDPQAYIEGARGREFDGAPSALAAEGEAIAPLGDVAAIDNAPIDVRATLGLGSELDRPMLRPDLFASPEEHARAQRRFERERDAIDGFASVRDPDEIGFEALDWLDPLRQRAAGAETLRPEAVAEAFGITPDQARRVAELLAAADDSPIRIARDGRISRVGDADRGPRSLLDFLSERGGVEDVGGDLRAMDAGLWHKGQVGRRRLLRERSAGAAPGRAESTAHGEDMAFAAAIEAGYFPEYAGLRDAIGAGRYDDLPDLSVFRAAVDRELRGSPVHAAEDMDALAAAARVAGDPELRARMDAIAAAADTEFGVRLDHDDAVLARAAEIGADPRFTGTPAEAWLLASEQMHDDVLARAGGEGHKGAEHDTGFDPESFGDVGGLGRSEGEPGDALAGRSAAEALSVDPAGTTGRESFAEPVGAAARAQADSLEHDLRMRAAAADEGDGGRYRLDADGEELDLAAALRDIDESRAAAAEMRACMAPAQGGAP